MQNPDILKEQDKMEDIDRDIESGIRKANIMGLTSKVHVKDHRNLHRYVDKLVHEVHDIKEHEHPYWSKK